MDITCLLYNTYDSPAEATVRLLDQRVDGANLCCCRVGAASRLGCCLLVGDRDAEATEIVALERFQKRVEGIHQQRYVHAVKACGKVELKQRLHLRSYLQHGAAGKPAAQDTQFIVHMYW